MKRKANIFISAYLQLPTAVKCCLAIALFAMLRIVELPNGDIINIGEGVNAQTVNVFIYYLGSDFMLIAAMWGFKTWSKNHVICKALYYIAWLKVLQEFSSPYCADWFEYVIDLFIFSGLALMFLKQYHKQHVSQPPRRHFEE